MVAVFVVLSVYSLMIRVPFALERLRDGVNGSLHAEEAGFRADVAFLQRRPGLAFCDSPMLCFRADRPFYIDPFNGSQAIRLGRVDPSPMLAALSKRRFAVVQLVAAKDLYAFGPAAKGGPDVEQEFRQLLAQNYHEARRDGDWIFYLPDRGASRAP
jgi:hypothetical protein